MCPMAELFKVTLLCPRCGKRGDTVWEREGENLTIVTTSDFFFARAKTEGSRLGTELACSKCGATVPPPS